MHVLVTGVAGFIGSTLSMRLLERGDTVTGIDNLNDYYDVSLKQARLARLTAHKRLHLHRGGHRRPRRRWLSCSRASASTR